MKLVIDNREPQGLLDLLKERIKSIPEASLEFENLDIGDFILKNNNNEVIMIFERKSLNDLISSIKDGRYNEQSFRLSEYPLDNHNIYYIIEGNINDFIYKNNETIRKTLFSSMLSLSYYKGFSLLRTSGWLESAEFLLRFLEKLNKEKLNCKNSQLELKEEIKFSNNYSSSLKTCKKSFIDKNNIGEIMLSQIPGISINTAQSLMQEYKTIKNLIHCLEEDSKILDNFKILTKNGEKNISKTIISNLIKFLV